MDICTIIIFQSMNTESFSIYVHLLTLLSLMFSSFQCTDLWPSWLKLFLSIFFSFCCYYNWDFLNFSSSQLLESRNITHFCILTLYSATLLICFLVLVGFCGGSGIFKVFYTYDDIIGRYDFISSFLTRMTFISFPNLQCYVEGKWQE